MQSSMKPYVWLTPKDSRELMVEKSALLRKVDRAKTEEDRVACFTASTAQLAMT